MIAQAYAPRARRSGEPGAAPLRPWAAVVVATVVAAFVSAMPGWQGVMSIAWLVLVAIAWRQPVAGLVVVAVFIPFEQRLSIPTIVANLSAMEFTVWALAAGSIPRLSRAGRLALDSVATMHLVVIVALIASIAAGGVRVLSWWDVVQGWVLALLAYIVARAVLANARARLAIVSALGLGIVANLGVALWQRSTGAGPESFVVGGALRVFGTFQHPNTLAAYLAFVLPILLAVALVTTTPWTWLWRGAAVAGLVTLVMTQSRGGMVALFAAVVVLVALAPRRLQRWAVVATLALAVTVAAFGATDRVPGLERFTTVASTTGPTQVTPDTWGQLERQAHWGAALAMLQSNPLFGVGAGEFNDSFRQYTPEWRFRVGRGHAHNGYLQLGAEAGVPGLLAFASWVGTIAVALWRRVLRTSGLDYVLAAGALGAAVAWAVNNLVEYQDVSSIPVMFALVVALGLGGMRATSTWPSRDEAPGVAR